VYAYIASSVLSMPCVDSGTLTVLTEVYDPAQVVICAPAPGASAKAKEQSSLCILSASSQIFPPQRQIFNSAQRSRPA
jgi:hypothetical protein